VDEGLIEVSKRGRKDDERPSPEAIRDWVDVELEVLAVADEITCRCPWCSGDRLYVNPARAVFVCFKCGEHGTATQLVQRHKGVSWDAAKAALASGGVRGWDPEALLGMLKRPRARGRTEEKHQVVQPLPEEFQPCFDGRRWRVPKYLTRPMPRPGTEDEPGRGLFQGEIIRHGLGFCREGRYRDRVVVPVACQGNQSFVARLMGREKDFRWKPRSGDWVTPPKYLTPRGANLPRLLWGYDQAEPGCDQVVLVEGVFDRIRLLSLDVPGVMALFGKRLTDEQVELLRQLRPRRTVLMLDASARAEAAMAVVDLKRRVHTTPLIATLPLGEDPDTYGYFNPEGLLDVLATVRPPREAELLLSALDSASYQ
jgi:hypothetical protein